MHRIDNIAYGSDAIMHLLFRDYEGRSDFEHHEVVSADLRENVLFFARSNGAELREQRIWHDQSPL